MQSLWQWFLGILVWLSADPAAITAETPKSAAAVAVAYAALTPEPTPDKPPRPVGPVSVPQPCPDGSCRIPGASPAIVSPARP